MTTQDIQNSFLFQQLVRNYQKSNQLIVAVDFDDTLCSFRAESEHQCEVVRRLLLDLQNSNINTRLIIYTGRKICEENCKYINRKCDEFGIKIEAINENIVKWYPCPSKLLYNIFLDDRAGLHECIETLRCFYYQYGNNSKNS